MFVDRVKQTTKFFNLPHREQQQRETDSEKPTNVVSKATRLITSSSIYFSLKIFYSFWCVAFFFIKKWTVREASIHTRQQQHNLSNESDKTGVKKTIFMGKL